MFECCGIIIPSLKCSIICLYRVPHSNLVTFFNKLELLLYTLTKNNKLVIIAGDINIDILKNTEVTIKYKDILLNYNFKLHINLPTRQKSCIDHILSNLNGVEGKILHLYLSDHETAQMLTFPSTKPLVCNKQTFIKKRDQLTVNQTLINLKLT